VSSSSWDGVGNGGLEDTRGEKETLELVRGGDHISFMRDKKITFFSLHWPAPRRREIRRRDR